MKLEVFGIEGIPLVNENDSISNLILDALSNDNCDNCDNYASNNYNNNNKELSNTGLCNGDIILIAETIISKSEGNFINLSEIKPSSEAIEIAKKTKKESELIQCVLNESNEIVKLGPDFIVTETHHGFVCANAGIDESNVAKGLATPMPKNPDMSAQIIRKELENKTNTQLGVIITDTQGRAFRNGAVGVAIGCSGINPLWDRKGESDLYNNQLQTTEIATADELAATASLLMGQANEGIPIVIIRGFSDFENLRIKEEKGESQTGIKPLIRPKELDAFR
ncbi:MAG: coenzyme F420-0:L-glutamate ligase [Methanobacteriaceae archaeon]